MIECTFRAAEQLLSVLWCVPGDNAHQPRPGIKLHAVEGRKVLLSINKISFHFESNYIPCHPWKFPVLPLIPKYLRIFFLFTMISDWIQNGIKLRIYYLLWNQNRTRNFLGNFLFSLDIPINSKWIVIIT